MKHLVSELCHECHPLLSLSDSHAFNDMINPNTTEWYRAFLHTEVTLHKFMSDRWSSFLNSCVLDVLWYILCVFQSVLAEGKLQSFSRLERWSHHNPCLDAL